MSEQVQFGLGGDCIYSGGDYFKPYEIVTAVSLKISKGKSDNGSDFIKVDICKGDIEHEHRIYIPTQKGTVEEQNKEIKQFNSRCREMLEWVGADPAKLEGIRFNSLNEMVQAIGIQLSKITKDRKFNAKFIANKKGFAVLGWTNAVQPYKEGENPTLTFTADEEKNRDAVDRRRSNTSGGEQFGNDFGGGDFADAGGAFPDADFGGASDFGAKDPGEISWD